MPGYAAQGWFLAATVRTRKPPTSERPGVLAVAYTERDASRTLILLCDPLIGQPHHLLVTSAEE